MDTVFITGGTGFIGNKLVSELIRKGYKVHVLIRPTSDKHGLEHEHLYLFTGDILDLNSLKKAMEGCNQVYHLAAYARNWAPDPTTFYRHNVEGLCHVLEVAKELGVERVVFTSSFVTFGPTPSNEVCDEETPRMTQCYSTAYEGSKILAEKKGCEYVEKGLRVVIVNPTRVYGPGKLTEANSVSLLIDKYVRGKMPVLLNHGRNIGNYAFVDDVVQGLILAMERGKAGERYILGGENVSLKRFFEIVDEISGKKHFQANLPTRLAMFYSRIEETKAERLGIYPSVTPGWVEMFLRDWAYSSEKAIKQLDYKITPLKEGIRITYEWLQELRKKPK